jgi:geranylgeranyl diphosphate synthase type I
MPNKPTIQALREQFEEYLEDTVQAETQCYPLLLEMISYHFGWLTPRLPAGKRLRPMLTLLSAELFSGKASKAYPAAAGLEILHNYTLIHDDIEDKSELRHGQLALWKKYGIAQAINTGDYLSSLAIVIINNAKIGRPDLLISTFLESAVNVTIGQHEDIRFESLASITEQAYLNMITKKTASLFSTGMKLGAISIGANHTVINLLGEVGHQFGVVYQIYDDYIGVWGDPKVTGKPAGIDLIERKKSYPMLLGIQLDSGVANRLASSLPLDAETVSELIKKLTDLGIQDQIKSTISDKLTSTNKMLDDIQKEHRLEVTRLKIYVNSLFELV